MGVGCHAPGELGAPDGADDEIVELVAAAEDFYRARNARAVFQVSSASAPPSLGAYLESKGYVTSARTIVAHTTTAQVLQATTPGRWTVETTDRPTDPWFDTYWNAEPSHDRTPAAARVCRDVLLAPPLPAVHIAVSDESQVIGVGQIVIERGWAGVQCMATHPAHRRRGAASTVLHHLALAATAHGVERMYLAVMADNVAARQLYDRAGFTASHEYSYHTAP